MAAGALLIVAAHLVDGWAYGALAMEGVYSADWGRLLRVMGYAPLWLILAGALVLHDWPLRKGGAPSRALRRGLLLAGAALASGIVGNLLKLVFRRERPRMHDGEYVFRAVTESPFYGGGLGLPSGHAVVAFGGAAMLARLFPRAAPVWYALAVGCAWSRVAAGAHFVSDVALSFIVAWVVVALLWRRYGHRTVQVA